MCVNTCAGFSFVSVQFLFLLSFSFSYCSSSAFATFYRIPFRVCKHSGISRAKNNETQTHAHSIRSCAIFYVQIFIPKNCKVSRVNIKLINKTKRNEPNTLPIPFAHQRAKTRKQKQNRTSKKKKSL